MTEEEKGHLEIEDRAADHAQDTKGAAIMRTNDTPNEGVITSYAQAPARAITAGGVTYAYRELGPRGGIPVIFFVHLAATLDNWDPRIIDPIARNHHENCVHFKSMTTAPTTVPIATTIATSPAK